MWHMTFKRVVWKLITCNIYITQLIAEEYEYRFSFAKNISIDVFRREYRIQKNKSLKNTNFFD